MRLTGPDTGSDQKCFIKFSCFFCIFSLLILEVDEKIQNKGLFPLNSIYFPCNNLVDNNLGPESNVLDTESNVLGTVSNGLGTVSNSLGTGQSSSRPKVWLLS